MTGAAITLRRRGAGSWAPALAAIGALVAVALGLRGIDLAAAVYRVELFDTHGFTLWDSQWYGGHFTLNYSVLFPPVAALLSIPVLEILAAATAALMFDRLVLDQFGRSARAASLLFAIGTLAPVAIGQLPFLLGEAIALAALWAATRRRWVYAAAGGAAASLASPLAGSFLALAVLAWLLSAWPRERRALGAVVASAALPPLLLQALFPGQGAMPFPAADFAWLLVVYIGLTLLIPARHRALRIGARLYVLAIVGSFVIPTAVGGNVSRLGESFGAPLAVCVLWPRRRLVLAIAVVPLLLLQWGPAIPAFGTAASDPSTHLAYFRPLLSFLRAHDQPASQLEIVPTKQHWEAAYVAPRFALARGWERQLDTAENPIFYTAHALTAASYRAWLLHDGVRYVALPDVPLDYAATAEGRLVSAGVAGLRPVWRGVHWRVFEVLGSPGLLSGPGRLERLGGADVALDATAAGTITLRVRYSANWSVSAGRACLGPSPGGWVQLTTPGAGQVRLALGLLPAAEGAPGCPPATARR